MFQTAPSILLYGCNPRELFKDVQVTKPKPLHASAVPVGRVCYGGLHGNQPGRFSDGRTAPRSFTSSKKRRENACDFLLRSCTCSSQQFSLSKHRDGNPVIQHRRVRELKPALFHLPSQPPETVRAETLRGFARLLSKKCSQSGVFRARRSSADDAWTGRARRCGPTLVWIGRVSQRLGLMDLTFPSRRQQLYHRRGRPPDFPAEKKGNPN